MSADDWLSCPVCSGLPENLRAGYKQFYGKVPEGEYNELKRKYEAAKNEQTVRVDYEYGLHADGKISLSMFAVCSVCNTEWKHQGWVK